MELFFISETPASPMPPTPVSAADRLIGLFQVGRSLERYVEEFVELAYLTNWSDARLNALFLDGLDESTIRFNEPDDYVSLNDTMNLILYLNVSKFIVEEVQDSPCTSRPVPPETRVAWPVRQPPSSSTYPSSELFPCVLPGSQTPESRLSKKRKRKKAKPSPVSCEPAPALSEPASTLAEYAPASHEQPKMPAIEEDWLIDFWTEVTPNPIDYAPALTESTPWFESAPVAANEPSAPVSAAEPASPVSAAEPAAPALSEPAAPASAAEPSAPAAPAAAEPAPTTAAAHEPTPTHKPTPVVMSQIPCLPDSISHHPPVSTPALTSLVTCTCS
ncbi:hypothetical protein DPX16_21370 [Anabarilius grahami]|uniref:Paternally-expressed gene 3 protein n=1 Tax=Anabarilius grahami TaxID=495550 RepID=A0A3N0XEU3_ANAGA|nr:hypothetical protein DPX16_21370 [Anabarilius grahami]